MASAADTYADYLHVIDHDDDYLHVIDDTTGHSTARNESNCDKLDDVKPHSNREVQQPGNHPHIEDDDAYQEIAAGARPNYVQVVDTDHNNDPNSHNEQNQALATTTSTGETSVNTTANAHQLQQVAVYGPLHNDEHTTTNSQTKRRRSLPLVFAAAVGVVLLACSAVINFVVNPTLRVDQATLPLPLQHPANTIEAFGIMRTQQDAGIIDGLLTFDSVIRNVISTSVDLTSSFFTAPQTPSPSLYWMTIAVEVPSRTPARVQLTNTNLIISKSHLANTHNDIITKSGVVQLGLENVATVQSDYAVHTAYWSGFCLNNIMQSLVAVFVVSSKQLIRNSTDFEGFTKIAYDTVIINEGNAWDTNNSVFVAPQSGIYVFSISIGFTSPNNPVAMLGVSTWSHRQNVVLCQAGIGRTISSDFDFISSTRVLHLMEGATVEGMFSRAESIYSDSASLATSLTAFLYSPACNKQVLWLVAKSVEDFLYPPFENPLPYDYVRFNVGSAWQPSQNTVVIATPGIYYVFVKIDVCKYSRATLFLRVNDERSLEIKSALSGEVGQSRSNGAVIRLATGDKLTMEVADESQTCLYGSEDGITFMGLLLTPTSV